MKTLIAYATKYGTTETCAKLLANYLNGDVDLVNLSAKQMADPAGYDAVVVGGPIYAGQLRGPTRAFCKKYREQLLRVRFGCFVCQASPMYTGAEDLAANFDSDLLAHASAKSSFGGEVVEEKLSFIDKLIMGAVAKRSGVVKPPRIDKEKIRSFALAMQLTDKDYKMNG